MQVLTTLRDAAPDSPDVRQTLSQAYLMKGDLESAIRETELAVRASPHNHELRLRLLRLYGADNPPRVADALACVAEVSASPEYSGDVEFLNASAMLHLAHGDYAQAVADNAAARKLAPSNGQLVKNLMDILYQSKDYQTLVDAATQYIQNQSTREWWLYHSRGLGRKNLGDLEGARADLLEALNVATDQHDDEAATAVVQSIAREIGVDAAIANVVGRFQGDAKWQLALVYLYNAKGDTADAQPLIERILADPGRLSPQEHIIALKVADTVYIEARPRPLYQKAYAVEAALLALRPDDLPTLNNIATHLAEDVQPPRPDKALQYAQHAVDVMQQSGQTDPSITDTYGWVQILDGKPQDGVETLRPLVEAKPFAEASYHLGEGYMRMSYPDEAQRLASQAADELAEDLSQRGWIDPTLKTRIDDLKLRADAAVKAKADAAAPQ
jgi:tetratricopeptide (TPR) repeat protein